MKTKLAIHHIGGRGGNSEIHRMPRFEDDFVRVFYDADESCIDQIKRNTSRAWLTRFDRKKEAIAEYHIIPHCIAAKTGPVKFHLAYNPNCSSLFPPKPDFDELVKYSPRPKARDSIFFNDATTVRTATLDAYSLDDLLAERGDIQPPDILSLDIEGGEMEVLKGADQTLRSAICVVAESEFMQLYDGQQQFGDLHRFLTERGFFFIRFKNIGTLSPFRTPIGLRGDGIATTCDVVYLRDPRRLVESDLDPAAKAVSLAKLAFCAIMWGQIEVALWAIDVAQRTSSEFPTDRAYLRFLSELKTTADRMPQVFPRSYQDQFATAEVSRRRYAVKAPARLLTPLQRIRNRFRLWRKKTRRAVRIWFRIKFDFSRTDIEQLLMHNEFDGLSKAIRRNRILMQMGRR